MRQRFTPRAAPGRLRDWLLASCLLLVHPLSLLGAEQTDLPYVSPSTVRQWQTEGRPLMLLDVREADEFAAGHIPGARHLAVDEVATRSATLPTDHPIIVYCIHSAHRAPEAARTLLRLGFREVSVLDAGIVAWQVAGFALEAQVLAQAPEILPKTDRCVARNPAP